MSEQTSTSTEPTGFFGGVNKILPFVQWVLMIAITVGLFVVAARDTQKDQSFEILNLKNGQQSIKDEIRNRVEDRDKQMDEMKKVMLTREVFEAYMQSIKNEQEQQRRLTEKILENMHK